MGNIIIIIIKSISYIYEIIKFYNIFRYNRKVSKQYIEWKYDNKFNKCYSIDIIFIFIPLKIMKSYFFYFYSFFS
jgi:hypothetical protein